MRIILASASPRRREILASLGLDFEVVVSGADENIETSDPAALVRELSLLKAREVWNRLGRPAESLIIASDTVVCCGGEIIGKPRDRDDTGRILRTLSGRSHSVYSGVAAVYNGREASDVSDTRVRFADISEDELEAYLDLADYADKAGAYAVQGHAAYFIEGIEGDYFTVVGLPVRRLYTLLCREFGISLPFLARAGFSGE